MINRTYSRFHSLMAAVALLLFATSANAADPWVVYDGAEGPGKGKHIVLVSGDEEYRSEEALPQLGKILARHHGFKCTVLFAIDPTTGEINPNQRHNIPGLEALKTADLMIIATRFRDLPDDQMKHIVDYVEAGKPIIGLRTATHAFNIPAGKKFAKYHHDYKGADYRQGFGRQVLGETWISHHGDHGSQSTRGIIAGDAKSHPIVRGIKDGDIWGPTDVYGVRLPLPGDSKTIVLGAGAGRHEPRRQADRRKEKRSDDADRLDQDLSNRQRQDPRASSPPRWAPRKISPPKARGACSSTPSIGFSDWKTKSPPKEQKSISSASTSPRNSPEMATPRA